MVEQKTEIIKLQDVESERRYNFIASAAKDYLGDTGLVKDRPCSPEDLTNAEALLIKAAEVSHNLVGHGLWDHFVLCKIYGEEISERYPNKR